MAKYRVLEKCFHDNHIRDVGDIIEYNGKTSGKHLQPLEAPKKAAVTSKPAEDETGGAGDGDLA